MRRVDSLERLLKEWEQKPAPSKFKYSHFEYTPKQFDNVPSIIPKFLLHLQTVLKPITEAMESQLDF